jgi:hypothetical protein
MRHRLLHTLVFSSSFLVDGCAMAHVVDGDAGAAADALETPDAFAPPDAAIDVRACEPGWPTTKGQFNIERDGVWYACGSGVDREDPDLSLCCVRVPEAP